MSEIFFFINGQLFTLLLFVLGKFILIWIEREKREIPKIKYLRILPLDCDVPNETLRRLKEKLKEDILLKDVQIFVDVYEDCLYHRFFKKQENHFFRKISKKEIEGLKGKGNKECWKYEELIESLGEMNENEEFAILAITTIPIYSKEKGNWIDKGTYDEFIKKEKVFRKKIRIALIPYQNETIEKKFEEFVRTCKHEIAHLYGISNYKVVC